MKSSIISRIVILFAFLYSGGMAFGQETEIAHNNDLWFLFQGKHPIGPKTGIDTEIHFRFAEFGGQRQQLLLRGSGYYKLSEKVKFNVGYTFLETYPYGEQPLMGRVTENNIWGQVTLSHKAGRLSFSHRYREEQRWVENVSYENGDRHFNGYKHANRLRYRLTMILPFSTTSKFYLKTFDEVFINHGKSVNYNIFNQNWLWCGIGMHLSHALEAEAGYQWQFINKPAGRQESNNTLQFVFNYKIPFGKNQSKK